MRYDIADIAHVLRGDLSFIEDDKDVMKLCSIFKNRIDNYSGLRQLVIDSTHFLYIQAPDNEYHEIKVKYNDNFMQIFVDYCRKNNIAENSHWYVKNLNKEIIATKDSEVIV